jgi:glycosyltransferase involved in cell wall biosynthesis
VSRRLLQAMAGARYGGAETFFVRFAAALQRAGTNQRVVIRRHPERVQQLRAAGVAVGELRFGRHFDFVTRQALRREIRDFRPDLVLSWMSRATLLCPPGDFVHVGRLGGYYDLKYYQRCDHLVGNTQAIVDWAAAQGWTRDRLHYLPNFVPDAHEAQPLSRSLFNTPPEAPLLLALGRLHPNKGFDLLLHALATADGVHLWLAGEGPLRASLERLAARLGLADRVRFLGWREDAPALMKTADALVCPSRLEPLGNVVIEAWSAGLPVLATASDGPKGLIADGETGILVPADGNTAALAAAIARVCGDAQLRARQAQAGRNAYEAQFTEAAVVARWREFLDTVAR